LRNYLPSSLRFMVLHRMDGYFLWSTRLLPDKKASSYKVVFDELNCNEYGAVLRPDVVLLDFERATMRAIREVYPDVE
jgi:hypothetical protein